MNKNEKFVNDCLMSMTLSLMTLLISRKKVEPVIGTDGFRILEDVQEVLEEAINAFQRSICFRIPRDPSSK